MRCSEFRDLHCAYIDDTLAGVELVRVQRHKSECAECAALDTRIRRALMVARSLTPIEPSPDFGRRLELRLKRCRAEQERPIGASFRTVAALGAVASLMMLGYVSESLRSSDARAQDIVLPPVVALAIAPAQSPLQSPLQTLSLMADTLTEAPAPVIVASVSAGMPFWPAALLTEQAPLRLASYAERH